MTMTDELKSVLAVALPVGVLLVGAMAIYGPEAKIEGAPVRARRRKGKTFGDLGADPRVYEVHFTEPHAPNRPIVTRVVAERRMSKAELKAILIERVGYSPDLIIVKARSEVI